MRIACLMPTYGRPTLVENAIALFEARLYRTDQWRLLILDDAGQIAPQEGDDWRLWSTPIRYATITAKYAAMLALLGAWWPDWEAVALQDDDDIYGPHWLAAHAEALESGQWSYPRAVYSLYGRDVMRGDPPLQEPSDGRFWASAAVRRSLLDRTGGFLETPRATFDQEHLAAWHRAGGEPGRPDSHYPPQYCYGWGRARHCSALMGSADWYERHGMTETRRVNRLRPAMDEQTRAVWRMLWGQS